MNRMGMRPYRPLLCRSPERGPRVPTKSMSVPSSLAVRIGTLAVTVSHEKALEDVANGWTDAGPSSLGRAKRRFDAVTRLASVPDGIGLAIQGCIRYFRARDSRRVRAVSGPAHS